MQDRGFSIDRLDHIVFPVSDVEGIATFYQRVLGMNIERFGEGRVALRFGRQKINLQPAGWDMPRKAVVHQAGTQDVCFIIDGSLEAVLAQLGATVVPMPGPCGCEIKGIDLAGTEGKLQPEVAGAIEVLMAIHGFVLFRNQVVLGDPSFLSCLFSRLRPCVWHPGP